MQTGKRAKVGVGTNLATDLGPPPIVWSHRMTRTITPQELKEMLESVTVLDVRRKADHDADPGMIPRAAWRDPEKVDEWSNGIPAGKEVVIYCVRGGSVSN